MSVIKPAYIAITHVSRVNQAPDRDTVDCILTPMCSNGRHNTGCQLAHAPCAID